MPIDRRADFDDFGDTLYLNCATQSPMPRVALAAVTAALELKRSPHKIRDADYFLYPDRYREAVARLIGAAPADVAVTDSTTAGIMLLVNGLDWSAGDEVVIPSGTFPANRFPWHSLERQGVRVVTVPERSDGDMTARIAEALTPRTRVVSVGWVTYSNGLRYDLASLGKLCRERGVLLAVDGTQGVGGLAFDLAETPVDLLACSGYKWLLSPYGLGFAWVTPALAERLVPANINWMAVAGAEDFNRLADCELDLVTTAARRFDRNEAASFFDTAGGTASAEYLAQVTPAAIEAHVRGLQDRLLAGLKTFRPVSALAPGKRSNLLSIAADSGADTGAATAAAFARLTAAGVFASLREGAIRISPHVYNSEADIDRVLDILEN